MADLTIGKQTEGSSPHSIKEMAIRAMKSLGGSGRFGTVADIGAGRGELSRMVSPFCQKVLMVDDFGSSEMPPNADFVKADLNEAWAVADGSVDLAFALEVIEHIENPRHFMREMVRILRPGGHGFVSTPNARNLFSRIIFLLKTEQRWFQDFSYPGHITALTEKDFRRLLDENGLELLGFYYNNSDTLPFLHWGIGLGGGLFSSSAGVLFKKKNG